MLKAHMDAKENVLVATSKIPANSGHSLHKGTPREAFITEFLESHLPENVSIGSGEIIDANSRPKEPRNQFDIVIYKKNYPKLDFGGGISGFLVESVIATVEVKSTLTKPEVEQAINAARNTKVLISNVISSFNSGYIPPKILNYIVAYDGPASMRTVYNWIPEIHNNLGIIIPDLPKDQSLRLQTASPSIDGIFVLNKGFLFLDNVPIRFHTNYDNEHKWIFSDNSAGNLLLLFLFLQAATENIDGKWLNSLSYVKESYRGITIHFDHKDKA